MRDLTADVVAELRAGKFYPGLLAEIAFVGGVARFWSGLGLLTWNSVVWTGTGEMAKISGISETAAVNANGLTLALSGIPSDIAAKGLLSCRQGFPAKVWISVFTESGAVIADPVLAFSGRMDTAKIDEGGDTSVLTISIESRLIDLKRARIRRYTDEDQQRTSPGDKGFAFVTLVQDWNGTWGKRSTPFPWELFD